MAEYPTVDESTRRFQEEGFELVVNATHDGFLAPAVNMHPRRPGHRTGPVGSGSTPEQAAFHAWEMFADHRDDYMDS